MTHSTPVETPENTAQSIGVSHDTPVGNAPEPTEKIRTTVCVIDGKTLDLKLSAGRLFYGKQHGVDLGDLDDGPVSTMFFNPLQFCEVIWACYQDRLQAIGFDDKLKFFDAVGEQAMHDLMESMKKACEVFLPWGKAVIQNLNKVLKAMEDREIEVPADAKAAMSGDSSGTAPESSA